MKSSIGVVEPVLFSPLAIFRFKFAAGKTVGPVAPDEKPSKSVVDAAVINRPAKSVSELMRSNRGPAGRRRCSSH